VETVAAGQKIANQLVRDAVFAIANLRERRIEIVYREIFNVENDVTARGEARLDEVLHYFLLRVHGDRAATGQFSHVDAMPTPVESEPDAIVPQSLALEAIADAGIDQQVNGPLFENARSNALLDVLSAAAFENDRLNAREMQKMREHQAGGTGADNANLSSHNVPS
jgi:hypothetical protein